MIFASEKSFRSDKSNKLHFADPFHIGLSLDAPLATLSLRKIYISHFWKWVKMVLSVFFSSRTNDQLVKLCQKQWPCDLSDTLYLIYEKPYRTLPKLRNTVFAIANFYSPSINLLSFLSYWACYYDAEFLKLYKLFDYWQRQRLKKNNYKMSCW